MIELGNINNLEKKVSKLFIQSLPINHSYYYTNQRKINLFSELYIYLYFYYEYVCLKETENKKFTVADTEVKNKLENLKILNSEDIDSIKELLNLLYDISESYRKESNNFPISKNEKYKKLTNSIIRKLKIEMLLK